MIIAKVRRDLIVRACLLLGILTPAFGTQAADAPADPAASRIQALQAQGHAVVPHRKTGKVAFIGTANQQPISLYSLGEVASSADGIPAPQDYLRALGATFGLQNPLADTRSIRDRTNANGLRSTRFQQYYLGLPVVAGELIVNLGAQGQLLSMLGRAAPNLAVDTTPGLDGDRARSIALEAAAKWHGLAASELMTEGAELSVYDPRLLDGGGTFPASLVWRTEVKAVGLEPVREFVLVDARSGAITLHFNRIHQVRNRLTYDANSTSSLPGSLVCDESNSSCSGQVSDAVNAHMYAGDTYAFYSTFHGRDSIDAAGMSIKSTVRYCPSGGPCPYANAFWNGIQMVYGAGFSAADDVVGHELTHGVTDYESGLFYYYQSGAINESLSDVWGESIDQWNGRGTDTPGVRWLMGEDIPGVGAIRSMSNPPQFSDPDKMTSANYYMGAGDSGGVHHNSGINNKAVYLMVDGGTFNGRTVAALGLTKTVTIYYRVQSALLVSGSDYLDLYSALYQACQDLIGTSGITSADCQAVRNATDAVEMNLEPVAGYNPSAGQCPAGQSVASTLFSEGFESGTANWSLTHTAGTYDWSRIPDYVASGLYSLWGNDPPAVSDLRAAMASGVLLPANAHLWFNHAFGLEYNGGSTYYDGGVLEYSTDGGSNWLDAGSLYAEGKNYGGTVSSSYSNPLGGRSAFVANSNGYVQSRYSLSALAGQTVRFRWRIGADSVVSALGWLIDDVRINVCAATAVLPAAPTIGTASAGNASVTVSFTPGAMGNGTLVNYTAMCISNGGGATGTNTGAGSPITVTGLNNGMPYTCLASTTTSAGMGPWSNYSNWVTPSSSLGTAPGAPTAVVATGGNASLSLGFAAPASTGTMPNGSPATITGYAATCSPGGSGNSVGAATSISVGGLTNGIAYTCTVRATNSAGLTGALSAPSNQVTPGVPGAPIIGAVTPGNASASVAFTPGAAGATATDNYRATCSGGFIGYNSASPVAVTGLTNGTSYTCTVAAHNSAGWSAESASSGPVVPVPPAISRTYVKSTGSDANVAYSCDFAHPCRTFQTAYSVTLANGEILALDGSGYGPITINRSVSIIANPGVFAGIGVFAGGTGVTIATAGISVTLRGLTINGQGGIYGVNMTSGAQLSVENCVIANFSASGGAGVKVNTAAMVRIVDSIFKDSERGVWLDGGATAGISGSQFLGNSFNGVVAAGSTAGTTTTAAVSDSVVMGTGTDWGISAQSLNATATVRVHVIRSDVSNGAVGVLASSPAGGPSTLVLSRTKVWGNTTGLSQSGVATLRTLGNNSVSGNGSSASGTISILAPM